MSRNGREPESGSWMQSGLVDTTVLRDAFHYSVLQDVSSEQAGKLPVVAASVEEKVADLIRAYPHLEAYLKTHATKANARIRDLAISTRERNHLLYQIIAARRQQLMSSGTKEGPPPSARGSQARAGSYRPPRKGGVL